MRRFAIVLLLLAWDAITLDSQPVPPRDSLTIQIDAKFEILDPHGTASGGDLFVIDQMYEGLVRASESSPLSWEPCLAARWETSADRMTWTFFLREGVKFHDGMNLNAQVVKTSFQRTLDPKHRAALPTTFYVETYSHIKAIETPQPTKVVFHLSRPDARFLGLLSLPAAAIISQGAIDKLADQKPDDRRRWLNKGSAGTGPFMLKGGDLSPGASVQLLAHDEYWGGKPAVRLLEISTQLDALARLDACRKGYADLAPLPPSDHWAAVREDRNLHLEVVESATICYLGMNCDPKSGHPTADKRVRQAIALAVDRAKLAETIGEGATPLHLLLPPSVPGHPIGFKPELDKLAREEALAKARQLVEEAGDQCKDLEILIPEVPRPYIPKPQALADVLRQQLELAGFAVKVRALPMIKLATGIARGEHSLMLLGWIGDATRDAADFWEPLLSGVDGPSETNIARFYDAKVAKLLLQARGEVDPARRSAIFEGLEKTVHDESRPIVPLFTTKSAWVRQAGLQGVKIDAVGNLHLGMAR